MARPKLLRYHSGFTLIELLITVAVIGILAAIAYPLYTGYVEQARRSDGQSMLMQTAGRLERCYTASSSYQGCIAGLDDGGLESADGHYTITASTLTASTYTLSASPNGAQADDSCGSLTLDSRGARTPDGCW
ncbi:type IV pilin protein [Litchfieldella rifensis]|uniref:Type IV pilin protein n=1 Tax=Litchfieldella rifensis TaxID=762643 RepID=A0ABV7LPG3_9GAMM